MEYREVERRLAEALRAFWDADRYLLEHNLSERCIAGRVAFHLQHSFPEYQVDVEYNRAGDIPRCALRPRGAGTAGEIDN